LSATNPRPCATSTSSDAPSICTHNSNYHKTNCRFGIKNKAYSKTFTQAITLACKQTFISGT
jgi:hypothetical protein